MMKNIFFKTFSGLLLFVSSACGLNMQKHYKNMQSDMRQHRYDEVNVYIDKVKEKFYSKDNRLLYYMDKGLVLNHGKRYEESNQFMEQAKTTADELWTESIGKNALAWVTTDNSLPYQGQDFEKVFLHLVSAFNYIGQEKFDGARVEARQVTNKLELYNSKYEEKNVYSDDAFARWLSGKLAATELAQAGQAAINDAWIDYRKAVTVYQNEYIKRYKTPLPGFVVADAMHAASVLGNDFTDDLQGLRKEFPGVQFVRQSDRKDKGEIVFIHLSGEAPYKKDEFWTATADNDVIRIAYPVFVPKPHFIQSSLIHIEATGDTSRTELAQDITAIAVQNLADQMGRIQGKAIARQVAKYIAGKAAQAAGKKAGNNALGGALQLAGAAFNAASAITEEADKRSWITLPSQIWVSEMLVAPGTHSLDVTFNDVYGRPVEVADLDVDVRAGHTTFVIYRTYR